MSDLQRLVFGALLIACIASLIDVLHFLTII